MVVQAEEEARRQESSIQCDDDDNETVVTTPSGEEGEEEAKVPCRPTRVSEPEARQHRRNATLVEQLKKVAAAWRTIKDKVRHTHMASKAGVLCTAGG